MPNHETYLGDGVYAVFDGFHVVLDLRGQDSTTRIALDPEVRDALRRFMDRFDKQEDEDDEDEECEEEDDLLAPGQPIDFGDD